jgi:hypothetical protein
MASAERHAEETRIRRILGINSYHLDALENCLTHEGHVPDSDDEQAVRDAACEFCKAYNNSPVAGHFEPSEDVKDEIEERESESVRYEPVRDLISMLATCKAKALAARQGQEGHSEGAAAKSKEA